MLWQLLMVNLRRTKNNPFLHELFVGTAKPLTRWEKCTSFIHKFMGLAIESTLESRNPITSSTRNIVQNVFESIRQAVKRRLVKYKQTPELYRYLTQKVSNLKLQIGLPSPMKSETYVKSYFAKLSVLKSNLFESYRNGLMFLKKMEERLLMEPHKDDWLVPHTLSIAGRCRYSASNNTVVVPRILLTPLVFEDKYPRYDPFYRKAANLCAAFPALLFTLVWELPYPGL